jgi:stage II sporulation protein AA (anti-sigma F factor antagonist)
MADFFRIESQQTLHVVELFLPELIDPLEFDRLNDAMLQALDDKADQKWVLDLGRVHYMGSAMLGLMVNVRQRIKAGGGVLVLCAMSPRLQDIFRACSMERLFTIVRTRHDALLRLTAGR